MVYPTLEKEDLWLPSNPKQSKILTCTRNAGQRKRGQRLHGYRTGHLSNVGVRANQLNAGSEAGHGRHYHGGGRRWHRNLTRWYGYCWRWRREGRLRRRGRRRRRLSTIVWRDRCRCTGLGRWWTSSSTLFLLSFTIIDHFDDQFSASAKMLENSSFEDESWILKNKLTLSIYPYEIISIAIRTMNWIRNWMLVVFDLCFFDEV